MPLVAEITAAGTAVALLLGGSLGLVPFFVARRREQPGLGVVCLLVCAGVNVFGGCITSLPLATVLAVVLGIVLRPRVADVDVLICGHCGRELSVGTVVCPRCNGRQGPPA